MDVFYALSAPTRRTIMELLAARGELAATDIANKFNASPPAISQHLKVLRQAKLVKMQKRGKQRIYNLNPDAMVDLGAWAEKLRQQWEARFDRLEKVLQVEMQKQSKKQIKSK